MLPTGRLEAESLRFKATVRQHRGYIIPQAVTKSSAPEDEQNNCPKHVERIEIINKMLMLQIVCCLYYEGNSISKLQIQVATYVFELSAGNCHR